MNLNVVLAALVIPATNKMKNTITSAIIIAVILSACHTTRNTQRSVTAAPVINQPPATTMKPVDSAMIIKNQLTSLLNTPVNFTTFYGKAKADFNSDKFSGNVTVYIRIQKDSVIWISVTGPLNIEGARVLITRDSVKVIDKIHGEVQLSSIDHLQKITKLPFNFNDFQNIILGKPSLFNSSNYDINVKQDSVMVSSQQALIGYIYSFAKSNLLLAQSSFNAKSDNNVVNANIFYNDYHLSDGINFSMNRDIAVTGTSPLKLLLNFKEYNFNQPQTYPFTISKNYTIKYD